jgi:hypothetical protein
VSAPSDSSIRKGLLNLARAAPFDNAATRFCQKMRPRGTGPQCARGIKSQCARGIKPQCARGIKPQCATA